MIKETRERHGLWKDYEKSLKNLFGKYGLPMIVGKWHYHYENKNGRIGLVRINDCFSLFGKKSSKGHYYEACGVLDFERFSTKKEAEIAIYKTLGEKYPKKTKVNL